MIESVEAFVPACRVAAGLAVLVEGIDQRQRASIGVWCDLETDLIRPPTKLEQRWRLEGEHLAVEVAEIADESKRRTNGPVGIDPLREPRTELLGIRQRAPDFVPCARRRGPSAVVSTGVSLREAGAPRSPSPAHRRGRRRARRRAGVRGHRRVRGRRPSRRPPLPRRGRGLLSFMSSRCRSSRSDSRSRARGTSDVAGRI